MEDKDVTSLKNAIDVNLTNGISSDDLKSLNPHIAEAIRAIQAERSGTAPINWSDFSSHNKG